MSSNKKFGHGQASTVNHSVNRHGGRHVVHSVVSQSRMGGKSTGYISSRSGIMSSASRKNNPSSGTCDKPSGKAPVQVLDEAGQDVTPQALMQVDPNAVRIGQSNILVDSSGGTPTDLRSSASIYQTGTVSTYGGGPFTRSVFSTSQSGRSSDSIGDDMGEGGADLTADWAEIRHRREEVKEILTDSDLEKAISIDLTETDMIWFLDMPGICVSLESDEAAVIKEKNEKYKALLKSRVGNDLYAERGMNTFNDAPKVKHVQTTKINYNDTGSTATLWDMFDTYEAIREAEREAKEALDEADEAEEAAALGTVTLEVSLDAEKTDEAKEDGGVKKIDAKSNVRALDYSRGTMTSDTDSIFASNETGVASVPDAQTKTDELILKSDALLRDLIIMERVVNLNTYQPKQASYRGFDIIEDIDKVKKDEETKPGQIVLSDMGPNLDRLWSYHCPLTKGRNISCMSWNKVNPNLIAVGYGQFEFTGQKSGIVCCWSLKNPEFPERIYNTTSGITSMDFSAKNPNLLAVGLYDGTVAIYSVRSTKDEAVLDSFESQGKHTGPVWQLKWIEKERGSGEERAEVLVSVSTDGRVTQWSIRKGFECNDLMRMKRTATRKGKERKSDALISRYAGGFCFDFNAKDNNIYLAGTEEGHIHKCSCSYNEQFLDSYFGHTGPVYKIQWSPFMPDIFLSCSADWSIKLWRQDRNQPIISFHSSTKSVNDICWSPKSSTVFACVNGGSVEVWDLFQNTLDPIIILTPAMANEKLSTVTFAKNSDCILVGTSEGYVQVLELRCMPPPPENQVESLMNVIKSSLASQLQNNKSG